MTGNDTRIIVLMLAIVLFPILAFFNKKSSLLLFFVVFVAMVVFSTEESIEKYERMNFFPWNEANLVNKRDRDSTVIDCAWRMDKEEKNSIFTLNNPMVCNYNNLSTN